MRPLTDVVAEIRAAHAADRLVIVTGAGVSVSTVGPSNAPNWVELVRRGGSVHHTPAPAATPRLEELLHRAEQLQREVAGDRTRWWDGLFATLHSSARITEVIDTIAALGVPIITLNYDALQQIVTGYTVRVPGALRPGPPAEAGHRPQAGHILHLHGWHDVPETVVLGSTSYQRIAQEPETQVSLRGYLTDKRVLFLGCGPDTPADHNVGPVLSFLEHIAPPGQHRHWFATYPWEAVGCTSRVLEPVVLKGYPDLLALLKCIQSPAAIAPRPPDPADLRDWAVRDPAAEPPEHFVAMCRGLSLQLAAPHWSRDALTALLHVPRWFRAFGVDEDILDRMRTPPPNDHAARAANLVLAEVALDGGQWEAAEVAVTLASVGTPTGLRAAVIDHLRGVIFPIRRPPWTPPPLDPRLPASLRILRAELLTGLRAVNEWWWDRPRTPPNLPDWGALRTGFQAAGDQTSTLWTWIAEGRAMLLGPVPAGAVAAAAEARWIARRHRHPAAPWVHLLEGDVLGARPSGGSQALRHYQLALSAFRQAGDEFGCREARASIARLHHLTAMELTGGPVYAPLFWDEVTSAIFHISEIDVGTITVTAGRSALDAWRRTASTALEAMLPP